MSDRRELRRRLGPVAWCALEDLADDASLDVVGRWVARTNVRRVAANLGVSKDSAARALQRLASLGLVAALPIDRAGDGRFGKAAYVLRVPAPAVSVDLCVERDKPEVAPSPRRPRAARSSGPSQPSLFDGVDELRRRVTPSQLPQPPAGRERGNASPERRDRETAQDRERDIAEARNREDACNAAADDREDRE